MKCFFSTTAAVLMLGLTGAAFADSADLAHSDSGRVGTLTLYGKTTDNYCEIPMEGQLSLAHRGGLRGCKNDDYYYFNIKNGQPGTVVTFMGAGNCHHREPTYHYLVTGGKGEELNMTTRRDLAHNGSTGEFLEANLETYGSPKRGRLYGKLSCVSFSKY